MDEEFDDEFDEEFDEDLDEELEEPSAKTPAEEVKAKTPAEEVKAKTPAVKVVPTGKKISVYFMSTIGPGEKKQKLLINTGNSVGDIKETVANLFGLDPADFHLSSGGITMDESSILSEYNINDGEDILLIPASTAG